MTYLGTVLSRGSESGQGVSVGVRQHNTEMIFAAAFGIARWNPTVLARSNCLRSIFILNDGME